MFIFIGGEEYIFYIFFYKWCLSRGHKCIYVSIDYSSTKSEEYIRKSFDDEIFDVIVLNKTESITTWCRLLNPGMIFISSNSAIKISSSLLFLRCPITIFTYMSIKGVDGNILLTKVNNNVKSSINNICPCYPLVDNTGVYSFLYFCERCDIDKYRSSIESHKNTCNVFINTPRCSKISELLYPRIFLYKTPLSYILKCAKKVVIIGNLDIEAYTIVYSCIYNGIDTIVNDKKIKTSIDYRYSAITSLDIIYRHNIDTGKNKNIMIVCPFCDQGLGIQAKSYISCLYKFFNVYIFSYRPYNMEDSLQVSREEWDYKNVYYSQNDRDSITESEVYGFVKSNNIGKCIFLETYGESCYRICSYISTLYIDVYSIPNIEMLSFSDIHRHKMFKKVLFNNHQCMDIFNSYSINGFYIGYSQLKRGDDRIDTTSIRKKYSIKKDSIVFLCVGGMNAFTRKNIDKVCEAFYNVYESLERDATLIVSIQKFTSNKIDRYRKCRGIIIIEEYLSYKSIMELYSICSITIHVSKKEGLGLGLFESLAYCKPVITLNSAPYNEIIKHEVNGYLIESFYTSNLDSSLIVKELDFRVENLSDQIYKCCNNIVEIDYSNIKTEYIKFTQRFVSILKN